MGTAQAVSTEGTEEGRGDAGEDLVLVVASVVAPLCLSTLGATLQALPSCRHRHPEQQRPGREVSPDLKSELLAEVDHVLQSQ